MSPTAANERDIQAAELGELRRRVRELEAREASRAAAQKHAAESEARFEALLRGLNVGVVVQGPRTEILIINARACGLLGVTEDQILGRTSFDPRWNIVREDGRPFPAPERPVAQVLATKQSVRNVVIGVFRPMTNDRVWLLVTAVPQFDAMGEIAQVVATFTDITDLKHAQAQVQAQQMTIAELSTPLVPLDNGIVLMTLVGAMEPWRMRKASESLLQGIVAHGARVALVDVAGIFGINEAIAAGMLALSNSVKLLGATMILTGIRADMARALSYFDQPTMGFLTRGTLQAGLAHARRLLSREI